VVVNESFPLASAPYVISSAIRVCGVLCGHGERWFPCPRRTPFYMPTATRTAGTPDQGVDGDPSINKRSPS
jgi:hypothetical protein